MAKLARLIFLLIVEGVCVSAVKTVKTFALFPANETLLPFVIWVRKLDRLQDFFSTVPSDILIYLTHFKNHINCQITCIRCGTWSIFRGFFSPVSLFWLSYFTCCFSHLAARHYHWIRWLYGEGFIRLHIWIFTIILWVKWWLVD